MWVRDICKRLLRVLRQLLTCKCRDIYKVIPLLQELNRMQKPVLYCPLDLSRPSIQRALDQTDPSVLPYIKVIGLWGAFEDAVAWANHHCNDQPRVFLSLGSMFGNDHFDDAVARLGWLRSTGLLHARDRLLLTMDGTKDVKKICNSYDDEGGLFTAMIRQGFERSNEVLGDKWYRNEDWTLLRKLTADPTVHRFVLQAKQTVQCDGMKITFHKGEEVDCYEGFKYGPEEMAKQFEAAELVEHARWKCPDADIRKLESKYINCSLADIEAKISISLELLQRYPTGYNRQVAISGQELASLIASFRSQTFSARPRADEI
jgi:uncharacterized SAM-dependent methyltransferase